jgi:serine/threonine-protein kinase
MGQVYKAMQKTLNRVVALKVIRKERLENPKAIRRFQREIRAAGQLSHPHIVRAFDADEINGVYFIAMEYIDGIDLARLVKDNGPLAVARACDYIRQAALGLQHAFERGMVHRDIKPANVLVAKSIASDRRSSGMIPRPASLKRSGVMARGEAAALYPWGVVKILDMGLARSIDAFDNRDASQLTLIGTLVGTPEYIAPEQARDSHNSDVRADLYSLGCTLFFLLTGEPPFPNGNITEKLLQHQYDQPPPVAESRAERLNAWQETRGKASVSPFMWHVPDKLQRVMTKLLAKDPDHRHQTPLELADDLQDIVNDLTDGTHEKELTPAPTVREPVLLVKPAEATDAQPATVMEPAPPRRPRRRQVTAATVTLASLGALLAFALVTIVGVILARGNFGQAADAPNEPPRAKSGEPYWKTTIRSAVHKKITLDEARAELLRHRATTAGHAHAKKIDEALAKLPTPLDSLNGAGIDAAMSPEVVGIYGASAKAIVKPVTSVAVMPNGRWLLASEDNAIRVFDVNGSALPYRIPAHKARLAQFALSPDGTLVASAGDDGARVWDIASRKIVQAFEKHQRPVTQIAFDPIGTMIASAGRDGMVRTWNPRTGAEPWTIESQVSDVTALAFSTDGTHLFWCGPAREIRWADIGTSASSAKTATPAAGCRTLAVQPRGNLVILGDTQGVLHVFTWDGKALALKTTLHQHRQVAQIAFAPDGKTFASVGVEPAVVVWDAEKLQAVKTIDALRSAGRSVAFAADGRHLVIGGASNQVFVLRLAPYDIAALRTFLD